jgi:gliding motility-associated lipoprotein GldK
MLEKLLGKIKMLLLFAAFVLMVYSCKNHSGQLVGVQDRPDFYSQKPFGMMFIPMGSYIMGNSGQDVPYGHTAPSKTVSVQSFYLDQTEITNNEYRQFVYWVRDSIAHTILGEEDEPELWGQHYLVDKNDEVIELGEEGRKLIDWDEKINWKGIPDEDNPLDQMFLPEHERYRYVKQIDTRKLIYEYWFINYKEAAKLANRDQGMRDRSVFVEKKTIPVYPDTLTWIRDFTYSFNEPMINYFWHPAYDHYPVVGVTWEQARAFSIWRTQMRNSYLSNRETPIELDFRLPTESEWEWAARGGLDLSPYPWGGPYIRNNYGCFLANYKPLRGNYIDDGGFHTIIVAHFAPNDFGLYDMSGNVAEWTSNAYDESAYSWAHDLNMDYSYEAKEDDPPSLKRKVIRGGSWKDIGYYLQTGTRTYEFQDTAKSYIGFRCAQTFLGRMEGDGPNSSAIY